MIFNHHFSQPVIIDHGVAFQAWAAEKTKARGQSREASWWPSRPLMVKPSWWKAPFDGGYPWVSTDFHGVNHDFFLFKMVQIVREIQDEVRETSWNEFKDFWSREYGCWEWFGEVSCNMLQQLETNLWTLRRP